MLQYCYIILHLLRKRERFFIGAFPKNFQELFLLMSTDVVGLVGNHFRTWFVTKHIMVPLAELGYTIELLFPWVLHPP